MNIAGNMKIGARLACGFGIILALAILITAIGVWQMNKIAAATKAMMEMPIAKERMVSDLAKHVSLGTTRITAIAKSTDASLSLLFESDAAEDAKASLQIMEKLEPMLLSPEEKNAYANVLASHKSYEAGRDSVMEFKNLGRMDAADEAFEATYLPAAKNYQKALADFVELQRKRLDADAAQISAIEASSRNHLLLLAALVLALGIVGA